MTQNYFLKSFMLLIGILLMASALQAQIYVNSTAGGANNGTSWADAFTDLQDALAVAVSPVEIWVAAGIYYPSDSSSMAPINPRNATFPLRNGVAIYGGFSGSETMLTERNWETNPTILSGDINQSDDLVGNSYSVVTGSGTDASSVIDGFIITMGNGNGSGASTSPTRSGGGMYNNAGSPTITNCSFLGNSAMWGGGMYNIFSSSPTVANCSFSLNTVLAEGGGMYNYYNSSPTVTNCNFSENSANNQGGGMYNIQNAFPIVANSSFSGNSAINSGGGMYNNSSSPTVTNCTFSGNSTNLDGGGMYNQSSSPTVTNSTFSGNSANTNGGGMYNRFESYPMITNSIIWKNSAGGNTATASASVFNFFDSYPIFGYSLIANSGGSGSWVSAIGTNNGNNIDADPLFVEDFDPVSAPGTGGDLRLQACSPAINVGDNSALPIGINTDLDGNPRIINEITDMGAFEYGGLPCCLEGAIVYVKEGGTGDGSSWSEAIGSLQDALELGCGCFNITQIWVAAGTYYADEGMLVSTEDRDATLQLCSGVQLLGGFPGTGAPTLGDRNWLTNPTILSGDINQSGDLEGNSYTVVTGSGTDATAMIDGFTITMGNADGNGPFPNPDARGGAVFSDGGSFTLTNVILENNSARFGGGMYLANSSNPVIENTLINGNLATTNGGGMFNAFNSSPMVTNITFSGNAAENNGGGMVNMFDSSPTITNGTFSGNAAGAAGGGMFNEDNSSPVVSNCSFSGNTANFNGGGMINSINSSPVVSNCTFSGNAAGTEGGGMYNVLDSSPLVRNCTFSGNTAGAGGGMYNYTSFPTVTNSIIWNNSAGGNTSSTSASVFNVGSFPGFDHSLIANSGGSGSWNADIGTNNGNNIDDNPLFVNDFDPPSATGTGGNLRLQACSPAINVGDNTAAPLSNDLDGNPRIFGSTVDLGAYELQSAPFSGNTLYINTDATGANNGVSWEHAFTHLQDALTSNCSGLNEIWVAAGTYYPDQGAGQTNNDRDATFQLLSGVAIYGGFSGNETMISERDLGANPTILSGDINQSGDLSGNSYSVVTGSGTDATAVIDGFNIIMGNADVSSGDVLSPSRAGGGMYNNTGSPTVTNCSFSGNAAGAGGGMFNLNNSSPTITNSTFSGNAANNGGGGMFNHSSSPVLTNSTFSGNATSSNGGGILNVNTSLPTLANSIIWNNSAGGITSSTSASVFNSPDSDPVFSYSLIANSGGSGSWDGALGTNNGNNIYNDPLFLEDFDPASAPGTGGDLRLQACSPAINVGNNAALPAGITTDLESNPRIVKKSIDMGAYEQGGLPCCPEGSIVYVKEGSTGDGSSWSEAIGSLQDAIEMGCYCSNIEQIWVAAGTYYADDGLLLTENDRDATFQLCNGVQLLGGFPGTGDPFLSDRNRKANPTILSGDINQSGDLAGNSYTVVTGSGTNATAVIDGFIITMGNSNGSGVSSNPNRSGGGMYNSSGGSPTVNNCIFSGNTASWGGGMFNLDNSSPTVSNSSFSGNSANNEGGGMYNWYSSSPTVTNCNFSGNSANNEGGGMFNDLNSSPIITNTTFSGNSAEAEGGGMCNTLNSTPTVTNSIIWNNSAGGTTSSTSASVFNAGSFPGFNYSLIANSGGSGSWNSDIGTNNGSNIDNDPLFVEDFNPALAPGTGGDMRLQANSPAIDTGNNSAVPGGITTDLDGNSRISGNAVDMGAYEFQVEVTPVNLHLSNFVIGENDSECFGATQNITIQDVTIDAEGSLTLIAGNSIIIAPGFNVAANGYFHAYISDEYCTLKASLLAHESEVKNNPALDFNENLSDDLRIFPNPTTGGFTIQLGETFGLSKTSVSVYNPIGELIIKNENVVNQAEFNLAGYSNGMYVIMIRNNENTEFRKLIKQ